MMLKNDAFTTYSTCDMLHVKSYVAALGYLLTRAGATQVSDYLAAVCDYNRAGFVKMKQLTDIT